MPNAPETTFPASSHETCWATTSSATSGVCAAKLIEPQVCVPAAIDAAACTDDCAGATVVAALVALPALVGAEAVGLPPPPEWQADPHSEQTDDERNAEGAAENLRMSAAPRA